jgi:hypothetical protein
MPAKASGRLVASRHHHHGIVGAGPAGLGVLRTAAAAAAPTITPGVGSNSNSNTNGMNQPACRLHQPQWPNVQPTSPGGRVRVPGHNSVLTDLRTRSTALLLSAAAVNPVKAAPPHNVHRLDATPLADTRPLSVQAAESWGSSPAAAKLPPLTGSRRAGAPASACAPRLTSSWTSPTRGNRTQVRRLGCLAGLPAGWLAGWLAGWPAGRLAVACFVLPLLTHLLWCCHM